MTQRSNGTANTKLPKPAMQMANNNPQPTGTDTMNFMAERKPDSPEPTLTDMTAQAIARLKADPDGFYLMVEGGRIDHGHHAGQAGFALEEAIEFARAVQYAVENTDPAETLIMVTADHSHVFTIAGYPKRGNDILGLVVPPKGNGEDGGDGVSPLLAADGKPAADRKSTRLNSSHRL